ncbi:MAG: hypothetical protein J6A01_07095 [Proteobacteria bacterium]|nr:hypothetical protein [Pseudomonadota bacterium]
MKLMNKAVIVLAVASLVGLGACKKSEKKADGDEVAQSAALMQQDAPAADQKWEKADVNGLLTFVPEDTAFVVASTRLLSDNPLMDKVIAYSRKVFEVSKKTMDIDDPEIQAQKAKCAELFKYSDELLALDLAKMADRLGVDPKFHSDEIAYNLDKTIVIKQSGVVDYKKLSAELDKMMGLASQCAGVAFPQPTEVKTGDAAWRVYDIEKWVASLGEDVPKDANGKSILPGSLAMNETNGILTVALVDASNTDALAATLKPAAKALTKDALGNIAPDAYALGYIDNVKAAQVLLSLDPSIPDNCKTEISGIVANFPRFNFTYRVDNDGNPLYNDNTLVLTDKAELKKLQELFVAHSDLINDKSLAGLSLNVDIAKSLAYAKGVYDAMVAKNYTCDAVKELQDAVKNVADLGSDPQAAAFINGISNLNVSLENFDMKDPANLVLDAVVSLEGASVGTTIPMLVGLAAAGSPELAKALRFVKGEVTDIDLTPMVQMPIKVKAYLNDTQLVVGTETHDVKAVADGKKVDDKAFLRILLDMSLIGKISNEIPANLSIDSKVDGGLGTNADGLTLNWNMKYKF